jgi:hypothetical protein
MRRKVLLLLPWVTLVLWLGNLFGCQAYNEVLPPLDRPTFVNLEERGVPLESIDRANWPPHLVYVHCQTVEHGPTWTSSPSRVRSTTRARGEYPTPDKALEAQPERDRLTELTEIPFTLVTAALEVLIAPVRIFVEPANERHLSPLLNYERAPGGWAAEDPSQD